MKGGRTESGLMDREIGMAGAFSDEGNEKAGVFAISRDEWLTGKSKICKDMEMEYRTLSLNEAEQFWSLMNQLDYDMARRRM